MLIFSLYTPIILMFFAPIIVIIWAAFIKNTAFHETAQLNFKREFMFVYFGPLLAVFGTIALGLLVEAIFDRRLSRWICTPFALISGFVALWGIWRIMHESRSWSSGGAILCLWAITLAFLLDVFGLIRSGAWAYLFELFFRWRIP
jgi:hypothetical protein